MKKDGGFFKFVTKFGNAVGTFTSTFFEAGRETVELILHTILPFMIFVSAIVGIIMYTGIGDILANFLSPLTSNIGGLFLLSIICSIPLLSPVLGAGAVISQVLSVLIGTEIGKGNIPPQMALPALFAINAQVMCDFIPVALSIADAEVETVEIGTPAMLMARVITGPLGVIIGFLLSLGLF